MPANSYMPYGGRAAICSVPVEWPAMSDRCLADFTTGRRQLGRTPGRAPLASRRRLNDIWISGLSKFGPAPARTSVRHRPICWRLGEETTQAKNPTLRHRVEEQRLKIEVGGCALCTIEQGTLLEIVDRTLNIHRRRFGICAIRAAT